MGKMTCPGCGAGFNGKRCRSCGYEHFSEEITHRSHTHRGEPLVIDSPVRKPIPRKDPFGCDKKTRKRNPLARFILLLAVIHSLMPMLRNWGLKLETMEAGRSAVMVQPEPVLQPENMVILHQEDDITIFTTPEELSRLSSNFSLYVHNESSMRVTVVAAEDIQVNGIRLPHARLVCNARPGEIGRGWLESDKQEWESAEIGEVRSLEFSLTVLGQDGRIRFETDEICLIAEGADMYG